LIKNRKCKPSSIAISGKKMDDDYGPSPTSFIDKAIKEFCPAKKGTMLKVLDFGCGEGFWVRELTTLGYDAYGCDINLRSKTESDDEKRRLSSIQRDPYRLPYEDNTFDAVISTSVLEHALNKEECFQEIYRVLRNNGCSMHLYPAKWYLPYEPHVFVPFLNMLWPHCPKWWLTIWAVLGVRNKFQKDKHWREVVRLNANSCDTSLSYWSNAQYRKLSIDIFSNFESPMTFYIDNADGGTAKLFRKLPGKKFWGWLIGNLRMNFIVSYKNI
jgi:SAM-dependent methyltransferase